MDKSHEEVDHARTSQHQVLALCLLTGLSVLSIFPLDVLLPSYTSMAQAFAKTPPDIAASLSTFIGFFAFSQLVVGPLSDSVGRRRVLLAGLMLIFFSVIGCAVATDYETFLAFRSLQAIGCSTLVLSQAIIQDAFEEAKRHGIRIYLVSTGGVLISLSPLAGTFIEEFQGWQGSFYICAFIALLLMPLVLITYRAESKTSVTMPINLYLNYKTMFTHKTFMSYWTLAGLSFSCHFTFIIISPLIFLDDFKVGSYAYGFILLSYGVAYICGGILAKLLSPRISGSSQINLGFTLILVTGTAILAATQLNIVSAGTLLGFMIICTTGTTLCRPVAASLAMRFFNTNAGTASAAGSTVVFTIAAFISAMVSYAAADLYVTLAWLFILSSGTGLVLNRLIGQTSPL